MIIYKTITLKNLSFYRAYLSSSMSHNHLQAQADLQEKEGNPDDPENGCGLEKPPEIEDLGSIQYRVWHWRRVICCIGISW